MTSPVGDEDGLPPLPRPAVSFADHSYPAFSAKQMKAYALSALASQASLGGWLPISTAPKDGTRFLAYEGGHHYALEWVPETPDDGYWSALCGQYVTTTPEPTHWMNLPTPPEAGAGGSNTQVGERSDEGEG